MGGNARKHKNYIMKKHIIIVGAGLVGSAWAVMLAKRGYQVDIYELRDDPREAGFAGGRSINLAMSDRGWRAMEKAGVKDNIRKVAIPMYGRRMHDEQGHLTFQPYGQDDQAIYSVSRGGLNIELINLADEYDNIRFFFGHKCMDVDLDSNTLTFERQADGKELQLQPDLIFGTDGAFSVIRRNLMMNTRNFNYTQSFLDYGYKEVLIPAKADGSHAIDPNSLHIWPRGNFMMIALPNIDGSFTGTLFSPYKGGDEAFENLQTDEQIMGFFEKYFPDSLPVIPNLLQEFRDNPTASLVTIRCNPWNHKDKLLIMGDASHAIVPFYGQGMNSGFEDCTILDGLIDEYDGDWSQIIPAFSASRPADADAIADLALRNFVEMRDKVADPKFLLRKSIAAHLHEKYPEGFLPLYSQVTFSHTPYHEAWQEGLRQDELFEQILALDGIEDNWRENPEVDRLFLNWKEQEAVAM